MGRNKILQYFIQVLVWGIVFAFPLFFTWGRSEMVTWERYLGYVFVPVTFMLVFYFNYFVLIDRLLFRRKLIQFLLANVLFFVVLNFGLDLWHEYYFEHYVHEIPKGQGPPKMMFILRDGMMMALTAALSVAIRMTENWYILEGEKKELEKARSEAELQNLKSQLNPHFLFNTLNNIYSLIAIHPERAQYALHDLSRMLRHVLYEDNHPFVNLDRELSFMRSYIELMSLRLPESVDLKVDLPISGQDIPVAPLLFITLVENAFKHGISPVERSFIHIMIRLEEGQKIYCRVDNSDFPKKDTDRSGSGIGLQNLRKRLELIYSGRYELRTERTGGQFVAELKIIFSPQEAAE